MPRLDCTRTRLRSLTQPFPSLPPPQVWDDPGGSGGVGGREAHTQRPGESRARTHVQCYGNMQAQSHGNGTHRHRVRRDQETHIWGVREGESLAGSKPSARQQGRAALTAQKDTPGCSCRGSHTLAATSCPVAWLWSAVVAFSKTFKSKQ